MSTVPVLQKRFVISELHLPIFTYPTKKAHQWFHVKIHGKKPFENINRNFIKPPRLRLLVRLGIWGKSTQHCTKNEIFNQDFFSKCEQIHSFQRIWSHLLKKSLIENFIFYAMLLYLCSLCIDIQESSQHIFCFNKIVKTTLKM